MNMIEQLQKLQTLREQGALSEEEFTQAKKRVIEADSRASGDSSSGASVSRATASINNLQRSWHDRWIAGVCGGLAVQTGLPTWTWRILFVLATLLHGFGILIYLLMWIFVPLERPQSFQAAKVEPVVATPAAAASGGEASSTATVTDVEPK